MATRTDIAGLLRNDEHNLRAALTEWFDKGDPHAPDKPPKVPAKIRVAYQQTRGSSFETLHEITLTAIPSTPDNILDEVEKVLLAKLGTEPWGTVRVRGWGQGHSGSPGLDVQRQLGSTDRDESDEIVRLRSELADLRRRDRDMHNTMLTTFQAQSTLVANLADQVVKISTVRSVSSAAADTGSIGSILAFFALFMFKPYITKLLDNDPGMHSQLEKMGGRLFGLFDRSVDRASGEGEQDVAHMKEMAGTLLERARHDKVFAASMLDDMKKLPADAQKMLTEMGFTPDLLIEVQQVEPVKQAA